MDAVLGYHMNPLTCGVAKFNLALSRQMAVPSLHVFDPLALGVARPLISVKLAEFADQDVARLGVLLDTAGWRSSYRLFLHAWSNTRIECRLLEQAEVVYCGNGELASDLSAVRRDVVEAWCPSTLLDASRFTAGELTVFSFGMAHKIRADYYRRLRELLDASGRTYSLYLSTALHETTTFDGSFTVVFDELRQLFGSRVYFLGYLSDASVYNYLVDTTFFAAFFERGVRANNTSVNAAMQCGSVVITNLDEHSPPAFVHGHNVLDIRRCESLPTDPAVLASLGTRARATADGELGWAGLLDVIRKTERQ